MFDHHLNFLPRNNQLNLILSLNNKKTQLQISL